MITFQEEKFFSVWPEMEKLVHIHHAEIAYAQDLLKLNLNFDSYAAAEKAGKLCTLTVRREHRLVGYYIGFVNKHLHYKDALVGINDVYYIHPLLRQGWTGVKMFVEAEKMLRARGAVLAIVGENVAHSVSPIFTRLNYDLVERMYWKRL